MSGFLENLLPTVIGGATAVFAPELLPYVVGAVGLGEYAKTGSIAKGVTAGLGAYGGSGLATGLAGVGATTAGSEMAVNGMDLASDQVTKAAAPGIIEGAGQNASNFASGLNTAISDPKSLVNQLGGYGALAKTAGMAASPYLLSSMTQGVNSGTPSGASAQITPYTYARNPVDPSKLNLTGANYVPGQNPDTSERVFFNPQYTALPPYTYTSAEGGEVKMADGGMAPSTFYNPNPPMSHNVNSNYANMAQMPMPQGVFNPNATLMADGGAIGYADRGMVDMKSNDMPDMSEFGNLQNVRSQMVPVPLGNGLSVMPNIPQTADFKQALSQFKQSPSGMIGYDTALSPTMSAGISAAGNLTEGARGVENVAAHLSKQLSPDSGISAYISKAPGSFQPSAAGLQYHQRFDSGGVANSGLNREGPVDPYTGMPYSVKTPDPLGALFLMGPSGQKFTTPLADGGQADGHLGDYSDGGRLLKGPGDGVSDSIPATIANKQPARLADGEFVVPARIVSELGNGSTDAGARKLYAMLDRIQRARGESVGKGKVAKDTKADRYLPA